MCCAAIQETGKFSITGGHNNFRVYDQIYEKGSCMCTTTVHRFHYHWIVTLIHVCMVADRAAPILGICIGIRPIPGIGQVCCTNSVVCTMKLFFSNLSACQAK